jgi:hypothetical protein
VNISVGLIFYERKPAMFWIFLMLVAFASVFVKLGSLSVWVSMLYGALNLALLLICGLVVALFWRKPPQIIQIKND